MFKEWKEKMEGEGPCPKYFTEICTFNIFEILGSTEDYFYAL